MISKVIMQIGDKNLGSKGTSVVPIELRFSF